MTAYTKEFEKWLNSSKQDEDTEEDEDDKHDGEEFDNDIMVTDDDIADEDSSRGSFDGLRKDKSENESAPILVDDDDDLSFEKQVFEDEPPVLEPVTTLLKGSQISTLKRAKLQSLGSIRNYSRVRQTYSRQRSLQEKESSMKTYEGRDKFRHTMSDDFEKRRRFKAKDGKESGNIFDKFNSISERYDAPPPLIPSPEVLKLHLDSHSQDCKYPNNSPEICAMEADSTSEITGDKDGNASRSNGLQKNYRDVLIECDSTCMLGASPAILSPASVSNGEMEEGRDSGGVGGIVEDIDCNESSKICTLHSADNTLDTSLMEPSHQNTLSNSPLQSELKVAQSFQQSFHTFTNSTSENSNDQNEPPKLEPVRPSTRYLSGSRRKRHTIDSWEAYIKTCKRHPSESSSPVQVESPTIVSTPPKLTHALETVDLDPCKTRIKRYKESSCHTKEGCLCSSHGKSHRRKGRRRHHTVPSEQPNKLDDNLHTFVVNTCILSKLQIRMHSLLHELFPQVRPELENMSPESLHFLELLSELVKLLQQPDDAVDTKIPTSKISCKKFKEIAAKENLNLYSTDSAETCFHPICLPKSTASSSQAATQPNVSCNAIFSPSKSQQSPKSDPSNGFALDNRQHFLKADPHHQLCEKFAENDQDILQFARLSLRDQKDLLPSVTVVLHKNPEAMIARFSHLSCSALQLLLPDLAISLSNELAKSPQDLLVFLDNVLMLNSTRKIKA